MCLTLECVCVFQSWKWPDWAQTETLQIWHSLSQSYMETPSSCQPALSNSMVEMVRNLILSVPLALKSMALPPLSFCLIHLQWFFKSPPSYFPPAPYSSIYVLNWHLPVAPLSLSCVFSSRWDQDGLCPVQEPGLLPIHRKCECETQQRGSLS